MDAKVEFVGIASSGNMVEIATLDCVLKKRQPNGSSFGVIAELQSYVEMAATRLLVRRVAKHHVGFAKHCSEQDLTSISTIDTKFEPKSKPARCMVSGMKTKSSPSVKRMFVCVIEFKTMGLSV